MNCLDADPSIAAYCDGELVGADREEVERHLALCAACAGKSRLKARFKAAVRAHLPPPPIPLGLRLRIRQAMDAQEVAPRRWPWLTYPRLVPATVAVVLLVAITGTVRQTQSGVLQQAQSSFQMGQGLPMDVEGSDCGSIAKWFQGRVGFPVRAPSLGAQGTCQGGRLVNVRQRAAAYITYRAADGHRVAFLVFDPTDEAIEAPQRRVVQGRELYIGTGPGISTAAYRDRGLGYVVTSDLDEESLTRLVTTSWSPR